MAQGLAAAHDQGIVHRDLKPKDVVLKLVPLDPAGVLAIYDVVVSRDGKSYVYDYSRDLASLLVVEGLQ